MARKSCFEINWPLEQNFFTEGQKNFGNKIPVIKNKSNSKKVKYENQKQSFHQANLPSLATLALWAIANRVLHFWTNSSLDISWRLFLVPGPEPPPPESMVSYYFYTFLFYYIFWNRKWMWRHNAEFFFRQ